MTDKVDRSRCSRGKTIGVFLAAALGYVLSIGPINALAMYGYIPDKMSVGLNIIYAPVGAAQRNSTTFDWLVHGYIAICAMPFRR